MKRCDDSFFYEGLIAEKGKYEMYACGEIKVRDKNGTPVDLAMFESDSDLAMINDKDFSWDMNNWFEVGSKDNQGFLVDSLVFYSYKQALKELKKVG